MAGLALLATPALAADPAPPGGSLSQTVTFTVPERPASAAPPPTPTPTRLDVTPVSVVTLDEASDHPLTGLAVGATGALGGLALGQRWLRARSARHVG